MRTFSKLTLTATFGLALALTFFGCGGDGGNDEPSSSSNTTNSNICYYPATQQCFDVGTSETCPANGQLVTTCPDGTQSSSSGEPDGTQSSSSEESDGTQSSSSEESDGISSSSEVVGESSSSVVDGESSSSSEIDTRIIIENWEYNTARDFEDGNGNSTISLSVNAGAVTATGRVSGNYAKVYATPQSEEMLAALRGTVTSVSFKVKGDGQQYVLQLPSQVPPGEVIPATYYQIYFTAPTTEQTVTACISDFRAPWWLQGEDRTNYPAFDRNKIEHIAWQADIHGNKDNYNYNFTISNVSIGNAASCTSTGVTIIEEDKWWVFTDSIASTITKTESNNGAAVTVTGNVSNTNGSWGVGWGTDVAGISTANSISFTAKGDGKTYKLTLDQSDMTNAQYTANFTTTNGTDKQVTLCLNDVDFQVSTWGTYTVAPFNVSKITQVSWQANAVGAYNITISNVVAGNTASCNPSTATGTPVRPWYWFGIDDSGEGGSSSVELCGIGGQIPDYEDMEDGVTFFKGSTAYIDPTIQWPYGYATCITNDTVRVLDVLKPIPSTSVISFNAKGSGKYKFVLTTSDITVAGEEHVAEFVASTAGQPVNLKLSDFKQPSWATKKVAFDIRNLVQVEIQAHTDNILGDFSLEIRDIVVK